MSEAELRADWQQKVKLADTADTITAALLLLLLLWWRAQQKKRKKIDFHSQGEQN